MNKAGFAHDLMDTAPLLKWLGLPPGPWPPDDRTLLGLTPDGPVDEATAEQNALARMELLRPHQLVHPELVTEGMNRLAQALIAATSIPTLPPPPVPLPASPPPPPVPAAVAPVFEAEVIEATVLTTAPSRPPLPPPPPVLIHDPDPLPVLLTEEPPPPGASVLGNRRKAYRELVFLRRLRRVWEQLGPVAGAPSDPVRTPEVVYRVRTTGRELRTLLDSFPSAATIVGQNGRLVTGVFTQPHPAKVVRDLVPPQRTALAADWAAGRTVLETGYAALRATLRSSVPRSRMTNVRRSAVRFLRGHPEWLLALITVGVILTGLLRAGFRPRPEP